MDIESFSHFFHQPVLHPMVAVGELSRADEALFEPRDFGMYCVILAGNAIHTLKPGQQSLMDDSPALRQGGWMLAFRPELLVKSGLGRDFYMFAFFDHEEAVLELSPGERSIIVNCFESVSYELLQSPDYLTNHMIRLAIGRLLSYCKRFYEHQYAATATSGRNLGQALDTMIDNYLSSGSAAQQGQPTVSWCADQFNLSPNYFGSLVKRELRIPAQEYIQGKILEAAKKLLATTSMSVGEIAEELGFSYPNHFTRLFKGKTGVSPQQYRKRPNGR